MGSVAVAVTTLAGGQAATLSGGGEGALPLASVVTLTKPRNCCPSAGRPSGSGSLAKNSMRYVVFGAAVSVPVTIVVPPLADGGGQHREVLEVVGIVGCAVALGVVGA